jgi:hypothetical protein
MVFDLRPSSKGVRAEIDVKFELFNASDDPQPFIHEVTVDDSDHGTVKEMAVFKNGQAIYRKANPPISERAQGYSRYLAKKLMIEPERTGLLYACQSSWTINRPDEDMWYNHMLLPTLGVTIQTKAPPEYGITPTFTLTHLVMKSEHLDIAWHRMK